MTDSFLESLLGHQHLFRLKRSFHCYDGHRNSGWEVITKPTWFLTPIISYTADDSAIEGWFLQNSICCGVCQWLDVFFGFVPTPFPALLQFHSQSSTWLWIPRDISSCLNCWVKIGRSIRFKIFYVQTYRWCEERLKVG